MKRIQTLCLLGALLCGLCGTVQAQTVEQMKAQLAQRYKNHYIFSHEKGGYTWFTITEKGKNGLSGICDATGKEIFPLKFNAIGGEILDGELYFKGDIDYVCRVYDKQQNPITPGFSYSEGKYRFDDPYIIFDKERTEKNPHTDIVYDTKGRVIIPEGRYGFITYDQRGKVFHVQSNLLSGEKDYGACDLTGKEIIPCRFYKIENHRRTGENIVITKLPNGDLEMKTFEEYWAGEGREKYGSIKNNDNTGDGENERLEQDERHVKRLMAQNQSGKAIEYLQQTLTNKYPTDANVQFGYATLLQELAVAVNNEGMVAAYSFDLAKAAATTSQVNIANTVQAHLLTTAAAQGHEGAKLMLQLKGISTGGGGGGNFSTPSTSPSYNSGAKKTCSLCHGKGWIAGNKTTTYGNLSPYWCDECNREVPASHSHDRCPSCGGSGTVPDL